MCGCVECPKGKVCCLLRAESTSQQGSELRLSHEVPKLSHFLEAASCGQLRHQAVNVLAVLAKRGEARLAQAKVAERAGPAVRHIGLLARLALERAATVAAALHRLMALEAVVMRHLDHRCRQDGIFAERLALGRREVERAGVRLALGNHLAVNSAVPTAVDAAL